MKRIALALSMMVLVFAIAAQAQAPAQTGSEEQGLIKLENEWADAWIKRDGGAYARFLADDYISTNSYGDMKTKAESIAWLKSDWLKSHEKTISLIPHDFRIRVYGDAAVINFRMTYRNQVDGRESSGQDQITDVWIKRGGQWQCVASHSSQIAQK
jgi:ketosteroid isomerase-like protein